MKKWVISITAIILMLTGCSSTTPELEYDATEMQVWQSCIDAFTDENAGFYSNNEILIDRAVEACQKFTPKTK
jgi:PBP1b-binding outer membrane lipoprotein LpoB